MTITTQQRQTVERIAQAFRATRKGGTPDEFRASMRSLRAEVGDDDVFEVLKGRGMSMAFGGRA